MASFRMCGPRGSWPSESSTPLFGYRISLTRLELAVTFQGSDHGKVHHPSSHIHFGRTMALSRKGNPKRRSLIVNGLLRGRRAGCDLRQRRLRVRGRLVIRTTPTLPPRLTPQPSNSPSDCSTTARIELIDTQTCRCSFTVRPGLSFYVGS